MKLNFTSVMVATALLFASSMTIAQLENPFIGIWDLDKEKSDFGNAPVPDDMIRTYQDLGDGTFMYLLVTINQDGSIGGSSAAYQYDKQENPLASLNQIGPTTISYQKLNEKTVEYTVKVDGRVTQIGAKTISPGGRVLTIAIQNVNSEGAVNTQILSFNRRR